MTTDVIDPVRAGELCPCCEEGHLRSIVERIQLEYRGWVCIVLLRYSICDYCQSELTGFEDSRLNKQEAEDFYTQVDNMLSTTYRKRL